jgi:IMP dehydrogenase
LEAIKVKFIDGHVPSFDLTYNDVFMVPSMSTVTSRFDVDLTPPEKTGTTLPIVVSNMNAVAGRRMAETVARRGGIVVLPQDLPNDEIEKSVRRIKESHPIFDTALSLEPSDTIYEAMALIHKRAHGAVVIVNERNEPIGIFTPKDADGKDSFSKLETVMARNVVCLDSSLSPEQMYRKLETERLSVAPIVADKKLVGVMTLKGALRSNLYTPALDSDGRLMVAAAIGINGDPAERAKWLLGLSVDVLVIDTAHGHQQKMIDALKAVRKVAGPKVPIVAGNVVTAQATKDLIKAGADIVKVGVGPGAMCTTRMMTGVGRPQFSAVLECATVARELGKHIWADGGVRHPRDIALALAAGASSVMIGSWFGGTFEAATDVLVDEKGRMYKENYGMASNRAVKGRVAQEDSFARAKKELYEEGISSSRLYLDPKNPSVEDIIDDIVAGVRSASTYAGARDIDELHTRATVGIQSASGYQEGAPVATSWN